MISVVFPMQDILETAKQRPEGYVQELLDKGEKYLSATGEVEAVGFTAEQLVSLKAKYRPNYVPPAPGAGTELKALLKRIGITSSPTCSCNQKARAMDDRGIQWCEDNIPTIVGWLRDEASKRGLPFIDLAGQAIVRLAISRAKKKDTSLRRT